MGHHFLIGTTGSGIICHLFIPTKQLCNKIGLVRFYRVLGQHALPQDFRQTDPLLRRKCQGQFPDLLDAHAFRLILPPGEVNRLTAPWKHYATD